MANMIQEGLRVLNRDNTLILPRLGGWRKSKALKTKVGIFLISEWQKNGCGLCCSICLHRPFQGSVRQIAHGGMITKQSTWHNVAHRQLDVGRN